MSSIYRIPAVVFARRARSLPTRRRPAPYRSAGRPEVMFVMERLIDLAARADRLRPDRAAPPQPRAAKRRCRTRNPFGMVYDSGDYHGDRCDRAADACRLAGFRGAPSRSAQARQVVAGSASRTYVEPATGAPRERAEITVHARRARVEVVIGTVSAGQGHETSFAQLITEWLGVPIEQRPPCHRRHRPRVGRRRLAFGPRDAARLHHRCMDAAHISSRRGCASPPICSKPPPPISNSPRAVSGSRAPTAPIGLFEVAPRARRRDDCRTTARAVARRSATRPSTSRPSLWLPCLRGRGRSRDRRGRDRPLHRGRRLRPRGQPDDRARPDPRRHRAGHRPGAVGAVRLRPRERPAAVGLVHGLRDAAGRSVPFFTTDISEVPSTTHPLGMRGAGEGGTTPALGASSTRSSMRWPNSASRISRCRRPRSASGARCVQDETAGLAFPEK